jgi:hypothetical protein
MPRAEPDASVTTLNLPKPHPGQEIVLRDNHRFKFLAAGRRWRKTTCGVFQTCLACLGKHQTVLWGAPTYDQCSIAWTEFQRAARDTAQFRESRMDILFPGGGRVILRSLDDPENARGHTVQGVVLDEAAFLVERAWFDSVRPMISDTLGWALIMSTPFGRNWFWRESMAAADDPSAIAWQVPTLGVEVTNQGLIRKPHPMENPSFPYDEVQRLWQRLSEMSFRQEFLAQFIDDAGDVFRRVAEAATAEGHTSPRPGHDYVIGVDLAKHNDFTVFCILDVTAREVAAVDRFNQLDFRIQERRLMGWAHRFKPRRIVVEVNNIGEAVVEDLEAAGLPILPFKTSRISKVSLIEGLVLAFEKGELRITNDPGLIGELQAYQKERMPSDWMRYRAPEGMFDDRVIALALAWHGAQLGGVRIDVLGGDETPSEWHGPDMIGAGAGEFPLERPGMWHRF